MLCFFGIVYISGGQYFFCKLISCTNFQNCFVTMRESTLGASLPEAFLSRLGLWLISPDASEDKTSGTRGRGGHDSTMATKQFQKSAHEMSLQNKYTLSEIQEIIREQNIC